MVLLWEHLRAHTQYSLMAIWSARHVTLTPVREAFLFPRLISTSGQRHSVGVSCSQSLFISTQLAFGFWTLFFPVWHSLSCQPAPEALQTSLGILRSSWSMCKGCVFSSQPFLEPLSKLLVPGNLIFRIHFCSDVNPDFFLWEDEGWGVGYHGGRAGQYWSWTTRLLRHTLQEHHSPVVAVMVPVEL